MVDVVGTEICWQIADNFLRLVETAIMEDFQAVNLTHAVEDYNPLRVSRQEINLSLLSWLFVLIAIITFSDWSFCLV